MSIYNYVQINVHPDIDVKKWPSTKFAEPVGAFMQGLEAVGLTNLTFIPKGPVAGIIKIVESDEESQNFKVTVHREQGAKLFELDIEMISEEEAVKITDEKMKDQDAFRLHQNNITGEFTVAKPGENLDDDEPKPTIH